MAPMTPEDARSQLTAAEVLATTSGMDARIGAFTTAGVGVLVAFVLLLTKVFVEKSPMPFTIILGVYASAGVALLPLVGFGRWQHRHIRVARRGFARRYVASFGGTMALFAIGVVWVVGGSWAVFLPYCVLVALPMLVMSRLMARR